VSLFVIFSWPIMKKKQVATWAFIYYTKMHLWLSVHFLWFSWPTMKRQVQHEPLYISLNASCQVSFFCVFLTDHEKDSRNWAFNIFQLKCIFGEVSPFCDFLTDHENTRPPWALEVFTKMHLCQVSLLWFLDRSWKNTRRTMGPRSFH